MSADPKPEETMADAAPAPAPEARAEESQANSVPSGPIRPAPARSAGWPNPR